MRLDAELQRMLWKIKWDDLLFDSVAKSTSSSRPSLVSEIVYNTSFEFDEYF